MPSFRKIPSNNPPANELAPQSTQQPQLVCTWSAHASAPRSGSSPSPFPRSYHTLTETANAAGELFLFGGFVNGRLNGDVYVFSTRDFSTTRLQTSGEVPAPRFAHSAALIDTTLLICSGKTNHGGVERVLNHDSLYLLDIETRKWSHVMSNFARPGGPFYHTTNVVGFKLFIFGGENGGKTTNDMWTLDLNRDCWRLNSQPQRFWESYNPTPGNEKPLPRVAHVSVTTGDHIIIFGGKEIGEHYYNDTWSFDISTRKWTELRCTGSIPSPRAGHAAVLVDGVMYVFGGYTGNTYRNDLIALQLSTQRWFEFYNVGPSPCRRSAHTMASDGTHVFVLGGFSTGAQVDDMSLIHVFDTKHLKYPEPECSAVNPDEKTTQLPRKSSTGPSTQEQPQHPKSSSSDNTRMQKASPAVSGRPTSLQIIHEQNPKFSAPHSSSEREVTKLELERRLAILEQAEANAVETARHAGSELREHMDDQRLAWTSMVKQRDAELVDIQARLARDMQAKFDEMLLSRDQQIGQHERELASVRAKLEATQENESEFRLRLTDAEKGWTSLNELAESRDVKVGQLEKELTDMRAKLDAKDSELEAVRLRLTDAEMVLTKSKAGADTLRAQNATGSMNMDRDDDQVMLGLMERVRAIEAEVASKRWNVKSIEEMECRNEG